MQNINLHNYQDFLLRYIDGELDLRETEALLAFVALHPEAKEELESLQSTKLDIETITCPSKALLYKNIFPVIVEPTTIVYPHKQKLFKKEKEKAPVVLLKWWAVAAAAVFLFMMVRYGMLDQKAGSTFSKNSISKNKVSKESPLAVVKNNAATNSSVTNNPTVNTGSMAATKVETDIKNNTPNALEFESVRNLEPAAVPTASTVTAHETVQNIPSYNGDIIDVKPTIIAQITVPSMPENDETTETIETIDTEAASSNRSVMVGAFEIDKDKFRGLFRKANALFKNKENNKNEK
jgi:anti-sigma factor RsiW